MKKSKDESKKVRRTPYPRFNIDIDEVFIPFDEVNQMSHLLDFSINHLVYVKRKANYYH